MAALLLCAVIGAGFVPAAWSPDGAALAFLASADDDGDILPRDWLDAKGAATRPTRQPILDGQPCELWIVDAFGSRARRLDRTVGVLSPPAWSPDGSSIAYTRFSPKPGQSPSSERIWGRLELVRRGPNGPSKTLVEETGEFARDVLEEFPYNPADWSDDGLLLAAPWAGQAKLLVYGLLRGVVEARITHGALPSWSPANNYLAYVQDSIFTGASIYLQPVHRWTEPALRFPLANVTQTAQWDRSGQAFFVAKTVGGGGNQSMEISRVATPELRPRIFHQAMLRKPGPAECAFAYDPVTEGMCVTILHRDEPATLEWLGGDAPQRTGDWHPIDDEVSDHQIPLGAPSLPLGGERVAVRFGMPEWSAPIAICQWTPRSLQIVAPNGAMRARALWALAEAGKRSLRPRVEGAASPFRVNLPRTRPTPRRGAHAVESALDLFPPPRMQATRSDAHRDHLEKLRQLASPLLAADADATLTPETRQRLRELSIFFDYVNERYDRVLATLNDRDGRWSDPPPTEGRMLWEIVRLQCYLAIGRAAPARALLKNLLVKRMMHPPMLAPSDAPLESLAPSIDEIVDPEPAGRDHFLERLESLWLEAFRDEPSDDGDKADGGRGAADDASMIGD